MARMESDDSGKVIWRERIEKQQLLSDNGGGIIMTVAPSNITF